MAVGEPAAQVPDVSRSFATGVTFLVALVVMLLAPVSSYWPLLLILASDRVWLLVRSLVRR